MKPLFVTYLAICVFFFGACASLGVGASFDPYAVGNDVSELQMEIDGLLTHLEQNLGKPDAAYERHAEFYASTRAELAALESMAAGDRITANSIRLIGANFDRLEAAHRAGIVPPELPILRNVFDAQFAVLAQHVAARKARVDGKEQ